MPALKRLLILGGTAEARHLAELASTRLGAALAITTSHAGVTTSPAPVTGALRRGGFGGAEGLADYLRSARVDLVVDATHPFAARISAAAAEACDQSRVPRLALVRPAWERAPGDHWIEVETMAEAAALLPQNGRRVFLTSGRTGLGAFAVVEGVLFIVRLIEAPSTPLPFKSYELLLGRGPFSLDQERAVLSRYGIDLLVTKASGGAAVAAKLVAARQACIPVVMLRRPPPPPGPQVACAEDAIAWLEAALGDPVCPLP